MTTANEIKAALLDEWGKLESLKAIITSPAGTYHDTGTGKFTSRPGGSVVAGGKKGGINREFGAIYREYDGLFDPPVIERI